MYGGQQNNAVEIQPATSLSAQSAALADNVMQLANWANGLADRLLGGNPRGTEGQSLTTDKAPPPIVAYNMNRAEQGLSELRAALQRIESGV